MMRNLISRFLLVLIPMMYLVSCSPARQEIDTLFYYMNEIKAEMASDKSEAKKQAILFKARKRMLTFIDTEFVAELSLGKYFKDLTKEEKKEFSSIFHELLAHSLVKTYIPINTFVEHDIAVELISEEMKHDDVFDVDASVIHTKFVNNKVWYLIDFYLHQAEKKTKLYDVHVDNASVLMDYRHQFYDIIESKGFPYLMDKLRERFKKLDQG